MAVRTVLRRIDRHGVTPVSPRYDEERTSHATPPSEASQIPEIPVADAGWLKSGVGAQVEVPPRLAEHRLYVSWRWPRRSLFSLLLRCLLVLTFAVPRWIEDGRLGALAAALVLAVLLSYVARIVFEAPVQRRRSGSRRAGLAAAARAITVAALGGWVAGVILGWSQQPLVLAGGWIAGVVVLLSAELARRMELAWGTGSRLFFVGSLDHYDELTGELRGRRYLEIVGHRDSAAPPVCEELLEAVRRVKATVLILSDEAIRLPQVVEAATLVNLAGVRVRDLRSFYEREFDKVAVSDLSLAWFLFDIAAIHRARLYGSVKRGVEAVLAAVLLGVVAPLLPIIVLAIKLSSPGPILFRQPRVGRNGEVFTLAKFRTMHRAEGREHGQWAAAGAARVFRVGRLLRRLRLDELPQLVSVVRGELSLVGPRPEQPEIAARLEASMSYYRARYAVRPGLTGWAQINLGYAGTEAGSLTKLQYDLFYIKRQSLRLDLRIIATTARAILFGSGS